MKTFIMLNLITRLTAVAVVIVGAYLIVHGHSIAGGWTIGGGIVALLFGGYESKSN